MIFFICHSSSKTHDISSISYPSPSPIPLSSDPSTTPPPPPLPSSSPPKTPDYLNAPTSSPFSTINTSTQKEQEETKVSPEKPLSEDFRGPWWSEILEEQNPFPYLVINENKKVCVVE